MNRNEKTAEVANLKEQFQKANFAVIADYKGLDVESITELRKKLREGSSTFKVVKNRLAKIALQDTGLAELKDYFKETTAISLTEADPTVPAKIFKNFAKDHEPLKLRVAMLKGKVLNQSEFQTLAAMPSKLELIAKMLGSLQAPATNLVSVLVQIPRQLVQVLCAVREQKEQGGKS